jgi:hypothetical protein
MERNLGSDPSRRAVLAGGGLTLAFTVMARSGRAWAIGSPRPQSGDGAAAAADGHPAFALNAFIRIDQTGPVRLVMPNIEMGQGSYTGQATIMAEELDIGLDQLVVEHAPPNEQLYAMPGLRTNRRRKSAIARHRNDPAPRHFADRPCDAGLGGGNQSRFLGSRG